MKTYKEIVFDDYDEENPPHAKPRWRVELENKMIIEVKLLSNANLYEKVVESFYGNGPEGEYGDKAYTYKDDVIHSVYMYELEERLSDWLLK